MNWAYVAGFFDGEGALTFSHDSRQIAPRIEISNCNSNVLEVQRAFTGNLGHINQYKPRHRHSGLLPQYAQNTQAIWRWDIAHRDDVRTFLEGVRPFLIIKKDLAQKALTIIAANDYSKCSHKLHRVDPEEIRRKYQEEEKTCLELGKEYSVHPMAIQKFMKRHNIPRRKAARFKRQLPHFSGVKTW